MTYDEREDLLKEINWLRKQNQELAALLNSITRNGTTQVILGLRAEVERLAEATNERTADSLSNADFIRGLERARDLVAAHGVVAKDWIYPEQIIQAEIDKTGKP